ncbi:unnamed protein product [Brassicogethes aeneus]|uniref:Uncharacterized protein n=1 Tax=Brassicogethes aeneus TaxID=1431903 RepID=A0A9P0FGI0_BRAAE|nr:unnamed protein product [Brassicogethes aeneus]
MIKGQVLTPEIKRSLLFGETLKDQIKENFNIKKGVREKSEFVKSISGKVTKKYRFGSLLGRLSSRRLMYKRIPIDPENKKKAERLRKMFEEFFERDDVSRMCPGKKDTVTFHKIKKQKRYLNDTLQNLHKIFLTSQPLIKASYAQFCKFRPFWVLPPCARKRETCLCKMHSNMQLLVSKLKLEKIINSNNTTELIKEICCEKYGNACLERSCDKCKAKEISFNTYDPGEEMQYKEWRLTTEIFLKRGVKKTCKRTVKQTQNVTKESAVKAFENYNCKYAVSEIQSAHFGASKPQISLHTVVFYYRDINTSQVTNLSICTLSENLRHDPPAICAHLDPVIVEVKTLIPNLTCAHFLSDGPSTQYKNKTMFYLMGSYLAQKLGVDVLRWHYSESGHGKGAPDGIGEG